MSFSFSIWRSVEIGLNFLLLALWPWMNTLMPASLERSSIILVLILICCIRLSDVPSLLCQVF